MTVRKKYEHLVQKILVVVWSIFFILFPVFFLTNLSDPFTLPKQVFLAIITLITLLLFAVHAILQKRVNIFRSPIDFPIFLFLLVVGISSVLSGDRSDSITAFMPYFYLGLGYFLVVNIATTEETGLIFLSSLASGGCLLAAFSLLSLAKLSVFPFMHTTTFTPVGNFLDQAIYFAMLLPPVGYIASAVFKGKSSVKANGFLAATIILIIGFAVSLYQLFFHGQMPTFLPFVTGLQIAFATISQDSTRLFQSLFFGSGVGTFLTDFTRFKQPNFNNNANLWSINFAGSSTLVLELLTTTGLIGILSYFFILKRTLGTYKKSFANPLLFSLGIFFFISLFFPLSFVSFALLFFSLALFSIFERSKDPEHALATELSFTMLTSRLFREKKGDQKEEKGEKKDKTIEEIVPHHTNQMMPILFLVVVLILGGFVGFYTTTYVLSDGIFTSSLGIRNVPTVYQKQALAINIFPYRDSFYRIFSQTNMFVASGILSNPKSRQSQQAESTGANLVQQSINSARMATSISPLNTLNWQNLAIIYRGLIGVSQNADQFAIASSQQAVNLDSANPQEYIYLGGIYYQLQQYDKAAQAFQTAVNVKPDFPNAYYNLALVLEAQGNNQQALAVLQTAKTLVGNNNPSAKQITAEITKVQGKVSAANVPITPIPTPDLSITPTSKLTPTPTKQAKKTKASSTPTETGAPAETQTTSTPTAGAK